MVMRSKSVTLLNNEFITYVFVVDGGAFLLVGHLSDLPLALIGDHSGAVSVCCGILLCGHLVWVCEVCPFWVEGYIQLRTSVVD